MTKGALIGVVVSAVAAVVVAADQTGVARDVSREFCKAVAAQPVPVPAPAVDAGVAR